MTPGRNEPCRCGSGKKYKHCCLPRDRLARESPEELTWRRLRRALDGFPNVLGGFVAEVYGPAAVEEARREFFTWEDDGPDLDPPFDQLFWPWLFHCWEPDPYEEGSAVDERLHGRPPTAEFLARRGARLDPLLHRYLEACLAAPFSYLEVTSVAPGVGFAVRDVLTGEEHRVRDVSLSRHAVEGDVLFAQVVTIDGVSLLEAIAPYPLRPGDKLEVLDLREQLAAVADGVARGGHLDGEQLREYDIELRDLYLDLTMRHANETPVLHNTDGELVLPQRLTFAIDSAEAALAALRGVALEAPDEVLAGAERDAQGAVVRLRFAWGRRGNAQHPEWENTVLGFVEITPERLTAEVNSTERAAAFRRLVEDALGGEARYLGSEVPDARVGGAAQGEAAADALPAGDPADVPEVREHLKQLVAAHYERWPEESLPALGGLTPLDAAKSAGGRERVAALVAQIERDSRRLNPPLDAAVIARLRARLGV